MDFGMYVLIGAAGGAIVGAAVGAIIWLMKAGKVRQHFNVNKGMTYEQIIAALGEPGVKTQNGEKLVCQWKVALNGKPIGVRAVFMNNIAVSVG